jgi:hypothetical protein
MSLIFGMFFRGMSFALVMTGVFLMLVGLRICPYPTWMDPSSAGLQVFGAILIAGGGGILMHLANEMAAPPETK